jgi:hypothetical protein
MPVVFAVNPGQIQHAGDLAYQMIVRYDLIKVEPVEKLLLLVVEPPLHRQNP